MIKIYQLEAHSWYGDWHETIGLYDSLELAQKDMNDADIWDLYDFSARTKLVITEWKVNENKPNIIEQRYIAELMDKIKREK